jgi:molecular chaperone HscB
MNHFEFYNIPLAFTGNEAEIRRVYLLYSKKYHPDFHTLSDESAQEEVLALSTRNNEAFKILSDPDQRIRYVLELKGLLGKENENAPLPQDFLMEMMDINEALMELSFDFELDGYNKTLNAVKLLDNQLDNAIQPILSTWSEINGDKEDLKKVREYFFKKRYLLRIKENLSKFAPA